MHLRLLAVGAIALGCASLMLSAGDAPVMRTQIEIWHGDRHRVGHRGDAQDDFNVLGRVESWQEIDTLHWSLNRGQMFPLSFRTFRRLVADGDFNADVPIATLRPGENVVTITARLRNGGTTKRSVTIMKETGECPLPLQLDWATLRAPQDAGQYVDGRWSIVDGALRTIQVGYDRVFLIGERSWRDYEAYTTITVHTLAPATGPVSGGHGVGLILRFAGHVGSGHRHFASGQPKWGYQPFGAIAFLRWNKADATLPPNLQFYPGDADRPENFGTWSFRTGETYALRFRCTTLPDTPAGEGVTRYDFKLWLATGREPTEWTWRKTQTSRHALRTGGLALVAHHVDVSYGPVSVTSLDSPP